MADYNSSYTGAQVDAALALANTAQQPPSEGAFQNGDKTKLDRTTDIAYQTGVNSLRVAILEGSTVYNNGTTLEDVFTDETGVNTGTSTAEYDATNDKYGSPTVAYDLLIQSETSDGSTTFTDTMGTHTITPNGDAQHDTAQAKFGSSSMLFDGTGDYLSVPDSEDFNVGSGDWTVQFWIRKATSVAGQHAVFGQWGSSADYNMMFNNSGGTLQWWYSTDGSTSPGAISCGSISADTWHHVAIVRDGNTFRPFVDGVQGTTQDLTGVTIFNSTLPLVIGATTNGTLWYWDGWIEEFAWTKGTALYTGNFTPPTAPISVDVNFLLQSAAYTTASAPTNVRAVLLHENSTSATLNTDITIHVSRDGGTTWTQATLEAYSDFLNEANVDVITTEFTDITSQPSGTSLVWKVTTSNDKVQYIHGMYIQWEV